MESIILIGHGSPKKDANNLELTAKILHSILHTGCNNNCVKVAYLQFAEPHIMETIKECVKRGIKKIILHPFFLSAGVHVTKDIPELIKGAEEMYPEVEFTYTEPLGIHEKLAHVVIERIKTADGLKPEDIEKRSFEIISEELALNDLPSEQLPIVKRVIHATADFEFKKTLMFHPDAVNTGIKAIRSGKDILTDVEMVKTGINKRLLQKWGGKVICNIQNREMGNEKWEMRNTEDRTQMEMGNEKWEMRNKNKEQGTQLKQIERFVPTHRDERDEQFKTRAERGIEFALSEDNNIGIIAIGNAPTALLKVIEIFNNSSLLTPHSSLVIGVPVGFVRALESKVLIAAQKLPFITNLSRKGGTPVAVAIVNALLKMAEEK